MNFSTFYLYNRWYTFPSSPSLKLKCHVNLNWGKKIQTETIQFSDIIFTQSDAEHNNGCHSQKHFTSALFVHKNTLLLCYKFTKIFYFHTMCSEKFLLLHYVFTKIFYFYAMCSQKIFYFYTMCSQKYFTSILCVHNNILVPHYVFTIIFYFYTMCSQQYFSSTLCVHNNILLLHYVFTNIFYFYTMCSQKYFSSTLCVHNNILLLHYVFTTIF
jgi:hypothetical protein